MYIIPAPVRLTQNLLESSALLRVVLNSTANDLGLTEAQWRVVSYINRGHRLAQTELALLLGMDKAPLGEQLDILERKHIVIRQPDSQDKRIKRLGLTTLGQEVAETLALRFAELNTRLNGEMEAGRMKAMQADLLSLSDLILEADTRAALARLKMPNHLHLVGVLARLLRKRIQTELSIHKLTTAQWRIVARLIETPEVTQKELGDELSIAKAPLGKTLDRLESAGWLSRTISTEDRRAYRLVATPQGKKRLRVFYQALAERLIPLTDFSAQNTEQLINDLQSLQQLLQGTQDS